MPTMQKTAYTLLIVFFGSLILREGAFLFVPLIWGVFFAFALFPISNWLEKRSLPKGLAIALSIVLVSVIGFGVIYLLLHQVVGLIKEIPQISQNLEFKITKYRDELSVLIGTEFFKHKETPEIWSVLSPENLNSTLFETGKSLVLIGIIPLYTFLLMYYKDFFIEFIKKYYCRPRSERAEII